MKEFIIDIYGTYLYKKKEYANKDSNGFNGNDSFCTTFNCNNKNYVSRRLKLIQWSILSIKIGIHWQILFIPKNFLKAFLVFFPKF